MLSSKDIEHGTINYGRGRKIVEVYTHKASGWRLNVSTVYIKAYKSINTYVEEVRVDGAMEYPIDGGMHKQVSVVSCLRYSDKALAEAHRKGEVMAMVAYGEHIKVGA
jgi:hypothetical protein